MSSIERHSSVDAPLPAYAYLWRSALIDVTPGTRKSHFGIGRPSFSSHGSTNPPTHASTWSGSLFSMRELAELRDRIDHAVRILRRRRDDADRAPADRLCHLADVGALILHRRRP